MKSVIDHQNETSEASQNRDGLPLRILAALAVVAFLYFARPVVLPVVIAAVAAMALKPVLQWLTKLHVPQVLSAILLLGCFLAAAGIVMAQLEGPAVKWVNRAPEYKDRLHKLSDKVLHPDANPEVKPVAKPAPNPKPATPESDSAPVAIDYKTILEWTGATLSESIEVVVLMFLFLASPDWYSEKVKRLASNTPGREWVAAALSEIQKSISAYLFSITIINAILGTLVGAGLAVLHFPNAAMWGVMAALLNYIPYFGPIVGIILIGLVSLVTVDSFPRELLPMGLYLVIHVLEADIFTPIILGRRFTIHPVMIFISLMFWTWIWGIPGALLSVPILMFAKVIGEKAGLPALSELLRYDNGNGARRRPAAPAVAAAKK